MKWRFFFQIVILLLVAGTIFYFIYPKYHFFERDGMLYRGNKIIGGLINSPLGRARERTWWNLTPETILPEVK